MSTLRTAADHSKWKWNNAKFQSALQTPAIKVSGPEKHRMVPKGILQNYAPKWHWHLSSASVRTIRIQGLPQLQLDFVLDWMLDGGDDSGDWIGPRVPEADVPTMDLLLGFVEALDARPLANRVKRNRNSLLLGLSPEEQAYWTRRDKGTEFLIASTGDTVETYVAGVRSSEGVTPGYNEKPKTDLQDDDSVVTVKMDENDVSGQNHLAEKNLDRDAESKEVTQKSLAGKVMPPICVGGEKDIAAKIFTSIEKKGKEPEKEGKIAGRTANALATEEEEHKTDKYSAGQESVGNKSVARDHTVNSFVADDIIRELLAEEQAEADYFVAEKLASEILAADVLAADLAEEEHLTSQQAAAWEHESERLAIETHNRLNPKSKVVSPPSAPTSSRSHLDATTTKQNKTADSNLNRQEKEDLRRAVQLSIKTKSTPYRLWHDAPIETPASSSSFSHGNNNASKQEHASFEDPGTFSHEAVQSRPPSRVGDTVVEDEDSGQQQEDIIICLQRETQDDQNTTTNSLPPPTATEAEGKENLHPKSPSAANTDIDNSEEITILLAQPPTSNTDPATSAAYHNDALIADFQASSLEDWCVRDEEEEEEEEEEVW